MALNLTKAVKPRRNVSLSTYFPKGTQYFYGYPAGQDSGFLNQVPPDIEELVAARAMSCAGDHVTVVGFAASTPPVIPTDLMDKFSIPCSRPDHLIVLPEEIDTELEGDERNQRIKDSLLVFADDNKLVMAQPYTGNEMARIYQISPSITTWLNDKDNMRHYIAADYMPKRLASYPNGDLFSEGIRDLELPYVVKVSSSSSGDGVYICLDEKDREEAINALADFKELIFVEQHINARHNYGVHFGIPHDPKKSVDFLGINEQLTTAEGEFIGGIIRSTDFPQTLIELKDYLINEILPKVRKAGWYGVGCFDILTDANDKGYFIDCNFRMTGMSAYHFLVANKRIKTPLAGFSGVFCGSQEEFEQALLPYGGKGKDRIMQIITLSHHDKDWNFNAALFFENDEQLRSHARLLLNAGIKSQALESLAG